MEVVRSKNDLNINNNNSFFSSNFIVVLFGIFFVATYTGYRNFLFFHALVELLYVFICFAVFSISLNSFKITDNGYVTYAGICCLFIGIFHSIHVLTFEGAVFFPWNDVNTSVQISVAEKYLESISLLAMFVVPSKILKNKKYTKLILPFFAIVTALLIMSITVYKIFPVCTGHNSTPTQFKEISEFVISGVIGIFFILAIKEKSRIPKNVYSFLIVYLSLKLISQAFFAFYGNVYDITSIIAHVLRLLSFCIVYRFVVEGSFKKTFSFLFCELEEKNRLLQKKSDDLKAANERLKDEIEQSTRIEGLLRKSENCYRLLIESIPEAIFVHSYDRILYSNQYGLKLLNVDTLESLYLISLSDYVPGEDKGIIKKYLDDVKKDEKRCSFVKTYITCLDGTGKNVEILTTPYVHEDTADFLSVIRDITQRKQMEELKKNVAENNRLLKEAFELDKAKTDFFTNMSHELRTPLSVMLCSVQTIESGILGKSDILSDKEKMLKYISSMKQSSFRLLRTVNNLLDISKIESGFMGLYLKNCNIVEVIEKVTLMVWEYTNDRGLCLMFDSEVDRKVMACDVDKIERIVLNLLSNAMKFTPKGGRIEVNVIDKGNSIVIAVKDTGIGIPQDKLDYVFERFKQVSSSLKREKEGTGLGLSIVKAMVEMHEGSVTVESEVGSGTTFYVELPVKLLSEDEESNNLDIGKYCSSNLDTELSGIPCEE